MEIMQECPYCGGTIGINAWQLARADVYHCDRCEAPVQPSHKVRSGALRLILARRRAEQEFAARTSGPEVQSSGIEESSLYQHRPLAAE
jgi:hypothetical protein